MRVQPRWQQSPAELKFAMQGLTLGMDLSGWLKASIMASIMA